MAAREFPGLFRSAKDGNCCSESTCGSEAICGLPDARAARSAGSDYSQWARSSQEDSPRTRAVVERRQRRSSAFVQPGGRRKARHACEHRRSHPQTFCSRRGRAGIEPKNPGSAGNPAQNRRPCGSPSDRDLLWEATGGTHSLDLAAVNRGIEAERLGDERLRRDGTEGIKKNQLQPWRKRCWCIAERDHARFVSQMEDVLDVYAAEHTPEEPLICMDEASKQLLRDERPPEPLAPG